jgi:hypothetical protein
MLAEGGPSFALDNHAQCCVESLPVFMFEGSASCWVKSIKQVFAGGRASGHADLWRLHCQHDRRAAAQGVAETAETAETPADADSINVFRELRKLAETCGNLSRMRSLHARRRSV